MFVCMYACLYVCYVFSRQATYFSLELICKLDKLLWKAKNVGMHKKIHKNSLITINYNVLNEFYICIVSKEL